MKNHILALAVLLLSYNFFNYCASAAVHSHSHSQNSLERESDGSFRSRDTDHYDDDVHHSEFDHEAILGSVKEAEQFDKLTPEESKRRLAILLGKMDLNGDQYIDRQELKAWILKSFINLSREEADDRMEEVDENGDRRVTWLEYIRDTFGVDTEADISQEDTGDSGMLITEEKVMFRGADKNQDGFLDIDEFNVFTNPEEHEEMHPFLLEQTLREKDKNKDGLIDFQEYIGERGAEQDKEWLISEKEKFDHDLDVDNSGYLDAKEIKTWIIPNNDEIAEEEVQHLFAATDDDHDLLLSFEEILQHYDIFVGSEATDYGDSLLGDHFEDEL